MILDLTRPDVVLSGSGNKGLVIRVLVPADKLQNLQFMLPGSIAHQTWADDATTQIRACVSLDILLKAEMPGDGMAVAMRVYQDEGTDIPRIRSLRIAVDRGQYVVTLVQDVYATHWELRLVV